MARYERERLETQITQSKNHNNCCVDGCLNNRKKTKMSFFALPKDKERRNTWLTAINRLDLLEKKNLKHKSYQVCTIHFDESMFYTMHKTLPHAVPCKYLPKRLRTYSRRPKQVAEAPPTTSKLPEGIESFSLDDQFKSVVLFDEETQTDGPLLTQTPVDAWSVTPEEQKFDVSSMNPGKKRRYSYG